MHAVGTPGGRPRRATAVEVADLELAGGWVVDVRRRPRAAERAGWLVAWEDDIHVLADSPEEAAGEASEPIWPMDAA
jgi:hypothetical protein